MQKPDLIEFIAHTRAKAREVNYNFEELADYVFGTAIEIKTSTATAIAQAQNDVVNFKTELQSSVDSLRESTAGVYSDNGLYVTTYINGSSWYREYFSDPEKTQRVFLMQGGYATNGSYVNLLRPYSNTQYQIVFGLNTSWNNWTQAQAYAWKSKATTGFQTGSGQDVGNKDWVTFGV